MPVIFDPATTVRRRPKPFAKTPSPQIASIRCALAAGRYPLPTSGGTANNYRRVGDETVDQDQFSAASTIASRSNRDQVYGRLTRFQE